MVQVLSYKYPLKKVILLQALYRYTATPSMVIRITTMDTHGSWQINLASSFWGISKADMVSVMGSLCNVIAVTKVHSFLYLQVKYICGASIQVNMHAVQKYAMWAAVESKNEPFLG